MSLRYFALLNKCAISAAGLFLVQAASAAVVTLTATNAVNTSSFGSNLSWSDAAAPSAANDYVVTTARVLRTAFDTGSATFLGNSLTLGDGTTAGVLVFKNQPSGAVITINNLTLNNGEIQAGGNAAGLANFVTLAGNGITLASGTTNRLNTGAADRAIFVTAPISGAGILSKTTAGYTRLSATNSYTGGTTILGGVLHFVNNAAMPTTGTISVAANSAIAVNVGGVGELSATGSGAGTLAGLFAGTGAHGNGVTLVAGSGVGIDTTHSSGTVTYASAINNLSILKLGTGTLELSNGGTYSGTGPGFPLVARQGTLLLSGGTHAVTGEITIGGTFGTLNGEAGYDAKVQVDAGSLTSTSWLSVGRGNGVGGVSSDLEVNNNATVSAVNLSGGFNGGGALNLPKGVITLNDTSSLSVTTTVNLAESAGSSITLNINDAASFSQTGTTQTRVGMANGAVGVINVDGGTASFEGDLVLGYAGTGTGRLILDSGTVNVASTTERWLKLNDTAGSSGEIEVNGGTLNLNANTDIRYSTNANATGTSTVTLNGGAITGGATSVIDLKNGTNATGNNTLNLNGGTLSIAQIITNNNNGTATVNFNGGLLKATANQANFVDLGGAAQSAKIKNGGARIDTNGFNVTVVQPLVADGTGGLTKTGAGTLTLSGVNTYTGATTITTGTLALASTGSIANSAAIIANGTLDVSAVTGFAIGASQTLSGSGSVIGNTTVNGILSAGNSAGVLTFSGNLSLGSGSTSLFEINGTDRATEFDGVDVVGSLTYGGTLDLVFGAPIEAGTYDLFSGAFIATGDFTSVSISGLFAEPITVGPAFAPGTGWTLSTTSYSFRFDNVSGDLTVSAVPEPSAFAALAGLAGLGAAALRRRRRA